MVSFRNSLKIRSNCKIKSIVAESCVVKNGQAAGLV